VGNPKSGKVFAKRPSIWKVLNGMAKRYAPQVTLSNDLHKSKGQGNPLLNKYDLA
jgi:hypothetical protein